MRCIGSSRGIGESFSGLLKTRPILIRGCTGGYAPMGCSLFSYLFTPFSDAAPQQRKRNVYMDVVRLKVHAPCPWDIKQSTTGLLQRLPQNKIPWIDGRYIDRQHTQREFAYAHVTLKVRFHVVLKLTAFTITITFFNSHII